MAQEFIEILSPSALKDLQTANVEVLTLIKNIDNAGKSMQNIKTPSGSDSAVKNLSASLIKQEQLLQRQQKALEKARLEEIKLQQQREKAFDKYEAQLTKEQQKLRISENLYNKVQKGLNALQNEYKALAIKQQLSGNLTEKETKRYNDLLTRITKYDNALKAVDATMGKHQRNVGNYASAFNPLSNSINQLTREMPAFTYSVQTGFMALSNNIPIFTDAIGNAIKQNKELISKGEPTTSVLKQLAGAFFSWQTAMGVGITLLTVYGKEIGAFIEQAFKSSKAIDSIKESQKQLNDINVQGRKNAVEETLNLKSLLAIAKDTNLSYKERMIAVKELQSTYPAYFGNLKQEEILAGNTATAERSLTEAILSRAKANAAVTKITENQAKLIDFEVRKLELQKEQIQAEKDLQREQKASQGSSGGQLITGTNQNQLNASVRLASIKREQIEIDKESQSLIKVNNILTSFALENQSKSILLKYKEEKATKDVKKAKEEELKVTEQINSSSLEALSNTIAKLKQSYENATIGSVQYELLANQIKLLEEIYRGLTTEIKDATDAKEEFAGIELTDEQVYEEYFAWLKLKQATNDYIKTLTDGAFNKAFDNIGLSSAKMFLDFDVNGETTFSKLIAGADSLKEKFAITFQAVGDTAQDVFNKMIDLSNQRFTNELTNLEREKEIAILFAGESASAREEIERQYEVRQREIKNREARAKKGQAIFNILIDTAQGVVSALASTPPNVPLSIAIGAIGAIQAGIVASQQVPQFYKGVENSQYEGLAIKDELGAELHFDKKGKIKDFGQNKGAKYTYVEKGDTILTAPQTNQLMHNQALNSILTNSGIMPTQIIQNSTSVDMSGVIEAIENKPSVINQVDQSGFRQLITNGHTTKENMNRRITGTSYGV